MVSSKQKRVLRYVEEARLMKLKSYLRKHSNVDLNFSLGKKQRTPLHLACSQGDDATLRLLLKHGADVLQKDRKGDTPLHIAAKRALRYGRRAYDDLVVPLRKSCPDAMEASNIAGVTPQDLLQWMKDEKPTTNSSTSYDKDPEKDWRDRLFDECQDEFFENFGQYDDDEIPLDDDDNEAFWDWADRIRKEYDAKQNSARAERLASGFGAKKERKKKAQEEEERSHRELHERLQREHAEYLARAARKEEETRQGRKKRYEERCAATFHGDAAAAATKLSYRDIPWPAPQGTVVEMVQVMLHGTDRKDAAAFRKVLRKQQATWHPDRFAQRCGARLEQGDKQRILDTVTALSQELNKLAQSLR